MVESAAKIPETGDIYDLSDISRQVVVESVSKIAGSEFIVAYPLSYSVTMASDSDFIFYTDIPFMAECWNSLIIPLGSLSLYKGSLDSKYLLHFSTYILLKKHNSLRRNSGVDVMTGSPIKSSNDIRNIFQLQEKEAFTPIRSIYLKSSSKRGV